MTGTFKLGKIKASLIKGLFTKVGHDVGKQPGVAIISPMPQETKEGD